MWKKGRKRRRRKRKLTIFHIISKERKRISCRSKMHF